MLRTWVCARDDRGKRFIAESSINDAFACDSAVEDADNRLRVYTAKEDIMYGVASGFGTIKFLADFSEIDDDLLEK